MRDLHAIVNRLPLRQRPAIQNRAQGFSLQQLRDQERHGIRAFTLCANVMNRQNIGMIQRRHGPRFLLKATQPVRFAGERLRKNL